MDARLGLLIGETSSHMVLNILSGGRDFCNGLVIHRKGHTSEREEFHCSENPMSVVYSWSRFLHLSYTSHTESVSSFLLICFSHSSLEKDKSSLHRVVYKVTVTAQSNLLTWKCLLFYPMTGMSCPQSFIDFHPTLSAGPRGWGCALYFRMASDLYCVPMNVDHV